MFGYAKKKRKTDRGNAIKQKKQEPRLRADRPSNNWPQINMFFFFLLQTYYLFLRWGAIGLKDCSIKRGS